MERTEGAGQTAASMRSAAKRTAPRSTRSWTRRKPLGTDRAHVLREAIVCCRKAGTVSIPGVYVGMGDKIPLGAAMNKGLTFKMGQTHVQAYTFKPLLEKIEAGKIDPSFVITHRLGLEDGPQAYQTFRDKEDGCIKVVLKP